MDPAAANLENDTGETPLRLAVKAGSADVVAELLDRLDVDDACQLGSSRAVREFSGWVDDDDLAAPNSSRQTALHLAAKLNLVSVVEDVLLKARACVEAQDQEQNTALHYACEQGNAYIVKALLDVKAQMHLRNVSGQTPCDAAERNQHFDIARQLQSEVRRRQR
ncbi:hypothetical protein MY1884_003227 [Beauveria asiatica]